MKLGLNDLEDRVLLVSTEIGMNRFKNTFCYLFHSFRQKYMKLGLNDLEDRVLLVRKENYMNRCKTTVCLSIS